MNGQWNWLIGRKLSLGEVVDVFGESATVRHGDDETRVLVCELLEEDYKTNDRYERDLNEAWNTGDGVYMNGAWPDGVIDHINGNRADNRWVNLRLSDATLNQQNQRKAKAGSIVDLLGVHLDKESGKYVATITHEYKSIHLGRFDTPAEAHAAYLGAKRVIHKACTI